MSKSTSGERCGPWASCNLCQNLVHLCATLGEKPIGSHIYQLPREIKIDLQFKYLETCKNCK